MCGEKYLTSASWAHIQPVSSKSLLDWKMERTKFDAEAEACQDLRETLVWAHSLLSCKFHTCRLVSMCLCAHISYEFLLATKNSFKLPGKIPVSY